MVIKAIMYLIRLYKYPIVVLLMNNREQEKDNENNTKSQILPYSSLYSYQNKCDLKFRGKIFTASHFITVSIFDVNRALAIDSIFHEHHLPGNVNIFKSTHSISMKSGQYVSNIQFGKVKNHHQKAYDRDNIYDEIIGGPLSPSSEVGLQ